MANYREDILDIELENGNLHRNFMRHTIGSGDALANRFGVRVFRHGEPVALTGTCNGYFINSAGATIPITNGVIDGNVAYVTLISTCYAVEGIFSLAIKVTSSGETVTMRIVDGMVSRTSTDVAIDPGTIIPSVEDLIEAIEDATAQIPADYSGLKRTLAVVQEDENGDVFSHVKFELGGINTDNGNETTRNDSLRSQFIPIGKGDSIQCIRLDNDNKASGWWANAIYYDENMTFIAPVRNGSNQYDGSFMRIPSLTYPHAAFVRFTLLTTNGSIESSYADVYKCFVRRSVIPKFAEKLAKLQTEYDILDLDFTNAGGISSGNPYDIAENSQRFRTTDAYPFPIGSMIVTPDDLTSIYKLWISVYWDAGRFDKSFFGDPSVRLDNFDADSFEEQEINYYMAIAGQTLDNYAIINDNVAELNQIIKIAIPKSQGKTEERLSGNVSGAKNIFDKVPFRFNRTSYYYETDGNVITQKAEDQRAWGNSNADFSVDLPAGTYHVLFHSIDNTGSNPTAIAFKLFNSEGTALIDIGGRYAQYFDNERTFTLEDDDTVSLQWKSYTGNTFSIYIYGEGYGSLKMVSNKLKDLSAYVGDAEYAEIYTNPVQQLVKKYDATADAGKIGYIWISDLHVNSLYPSRNKALKRQLMACADIANRTNIQFIVIGGDIIDRETSHATIYEIFNEVFAGIKDSRRPVAVILGNHDDNPYTNEVPLTKNQDRALFVDMSNVDMIAPDSSKNYYYFDRMGYRFICLDGIDYPSGYAGDDWWGFSQAQVEWLAGVLGQTTQKTIIFSHITLDEDHESWGLGNNGGYTKDIRDLLEAYNGRSSVTLYGNTYNFSTATGKVLFVHAGHAHFDEQYTKSGMTIPLLITTCAKDETSLSGLVLVSGNTYEAGGEGNHWNTTGWTCKFWPERVLETITEAAFDVVSVGGSTVRVFRVGAGEDRSFTPAT